MKRLHGTVALVLCAAATLVVGITGCRGSDKTIAGTSLKIDFELPYDVPESVEGRFCNGARSIVLAIDESVGGTTFDHILLLDTSYRLYGCGGPAEPCPRGINLNRKLTVPQRVVAEWVDVAPENYAAGPSNVICRGMYDAVSNMGDLNLDPPDGSGLIEVTIPLLRVGAMNGYFSRFSPGMQPTGTFLGVSPLVLATDLLLVNETLRANEGGKILAAGGLVGGVPMTGVYVFEPDNLGFTSMPGASLPEGRAALSATAFATSSTNHFVVLAGGAGADMLSTTGSWIFTGDDQSGALLPGPSMGSPRAHHKATYVSGIADTTSFRDGIVMLGGCNLDGSGASMTGVDIELFLPTPTTDPAFFCETPANGGVFCRRSAVNAPPPACQMSVGRVGRTDTPNETILWIGGGGEAGLPNVTGSRDLDRRLNQTFARSGGALPGLRGSAITESVLPNSLLVIGGDLTELGSNLPTNDVFLVDGVSNDTPAAIAKMNVARAFHTATRLLDRRILVAGGKDSLGEPRSSYELGAMVGTSLQFTFESVLAGPDCAPTGDGTDCSALRVARAEHSAEIIRGNATWLNGSVLLVGGSDSAQPEIYVPAYECDPSGLRPVATVGGPETVIDEVDFCDRGRAPFSPIMDPSAESPD